MIFTTVGTHEQQFNRLVIEIDRLKGDGIITDEVFIQRGYSDYIPNFCESTQFLSYEDMDKFIEKASLIITHGGPSSFLHVISKKKPLIIVPRRYGYMEHINDHQFDFLTNLNFRGFELPVIDDIEKIGDLIKEIISNNKRSKFVSNNRKFNEDLASEISKILSI